MIIKKAILLFTFFLIGFNSLAQVELLPFDFEGRDSLLNCKIIERYEDLIKYINQYVDPNTATEDRYHLNISIFRLLSDDPIYNSAVGINDISLEGKKNINYNRSDYLRLLNDLQNFSYVYQKEFLSTGAPYSRRKQTQIQNPVQTDFDISYRSPFYHFGFDYIENSVKSEEITSDLRASSKINFNKYLMLKKMQGRFSKMITEAKYEANGVDYTNKLNSYNEYCVNYDSRDTIRTAKCQNDFEEIIKLERKLRSLEIKFQSVYEYEIDNFKKEDRKLRESLKECNCPEIEQPFDNDGDGYSYIVDCDDDNIDVYPGAPINCDKWGNDDNCDGIPDVCCEDKDGDGFYSSIDCDCTDNLDSEYLFDKCDCNDDPINGGASIYPGASIDCTNNYDDDNCDGLKDSFQLQIGPEIELTFADNLYPPYGLTNFAKDRRFYIYSGLMLAGIGSSIYHKVQSNKYYTRYESAETFRIQGSNYINANNNHKRFVVSAAFTAGVYLTSFIDLRIRYAKYNNIRNEINQRNAGCALIYNIELNPIDLTSVGVGPSLKMRF